MTVCDIRMMLGFAAKENTTDTGIIMMELGDQKMGILVDNITKILKVKTSEIDPTTVSEGNQTIQGTWAAKRSSLHPFVH
ncbi:MAG: chemotaxis protein CheW [Gammaproteobacteria bacterium]|nr:chemotaxis protein CheW [Gammaproteobacteria bacterium]